MSSEKALSSASASASAPLASPHAELCRGINGLDKVVLRDPRGSSAEVPNLMITCFVFPYLWLDLSFCFGNSVSFLWNLGLGVVVNRKAQISVELNAVFGLFCLILCESDWKDFGSWGLLMKENFAKWYYFNNKLYKFGRI